MSLFHWTDGNIHTTALTPRDYQTELLATAREENLIVCIAHNSAKEFLAVKLIQSMRTNRWSSHPEAPGKAIYLTRMDRSLLSSMVSNLTDLQVANVDDVEDSEGSHEPDGASNTPVTDVASADVLFFGSETTLLQYIEQGTVRVQDISLLIVDECHKNYGRQELWEICARLTHQAPSSDRPAQRTRILGLAGPLHGAGCTPERLCWELHYLERCLRARIETASDITSVLR